MFLDLNGQVYDYFGGVDDLKEKRIRFAGNPVDRIIEDYLRIFRYFRFYARYGCGNIHEEEIIEAMKANLDGLKQISGERIWSEMKRILPIPACDSVIPMMFFDLDIPKYMGFRERSPEDKQKWIENQRNEFKKIHSILFSQLNPGKIFNPVTLLVSLVEDFEEYSEVTLRLKCSKLETDSGLFILSNRKLPESQTTLKKMKRILALTSKMSVECLSSYMKEYLRYSGRFDDLKELSEWPIPVFPVRGQSLMAKVSKPRYIGDAIQELKEIWADSDFKMTEGELLLRADEVLEKVLSDGSTRQNC